MTIGTTDPPAMVRLDSIDILSAGVNTSIVQIHIVVRLSIFPPSYLVYIALT